MKPHPRIRKTIKWGGAAATVLLVVVWIGSGWVVLGWGHSPRNRARHPRRELLRRWPDRRIAERSSVRTCLRLATVSVRVVVRVGAQLVPVAGKVASLAARDGIADDYDGRLAS